MQVRSAGEEAWLGGAALVDPLLDAPDPPTPLFQQQLQNPAQIGNAGTGLDLTPYNPNASKYSVPSHVLICNRN